MLFNSYEFIFVFLPLVFAAYYLLNAGKLYRGAQIVLVLASLFFYSWWKVRYLPLILGSVLVNYGLGTILSKEGFNWKINRKALMIAGIIFNLSLLGYYKYTDFLIENINLLFAGHIKTMGILLPLGISFFTFQQITYLVDAYRGETREYDFLRYALFVTFFPQLIAGPIVHHKEMMPQFEDRASQNINYAKIATGVFVFVIGLFKKVVIADTFAVWATYGFDTAGQLTFIEAWITSLSYTFQLYFDFSAYSDMAIGAALLFNINLPINFNSPYKAVNVQEFWRRWHMTLSRFLRDYVYIPLGGNRRGECTLYRNLLLTFLIAGLWHGAGWTFVFWGFLHGLALVIHRAWQKVKKRVNLKPDLKPVYILSWLLTFNFVNFSWVFFRAREWSDAVKVLKGMAGLNGFALPNFLAAKLASLGSWGIVFGSWEFGRDAVLHAPVMIVLAFILVLSVKNSMEMKDSFRPDSKAALLAAVLAVAALLSMNRISEFLYFNF